MSGAVATVERGAANDCTRCLARIDGTLQKYCYHAAFEESYPGDGPVIPAYPETPDWCPGMIPDDESAA